MPVVELFADLSAWSVILFVVGLLLLVIEMLHPGFGAPGVLGIACMIVDVCLTAKTWAQGLLLTAVVLVIVAVFCVVCIILAQKGRLPGKLILKQSTDAASGFSAAAANEQAALLGKTGQASTDLRPAGIAVFEGQRLDVVTQGDFVARGETVRVTAMEGNRIVVSPAGVPARV